jgi:YD repeat-containing protein
VGNSVRQETQVYTGSGHETLSWTRYTYDDQGHLAATTASDGTTTTSTWACCGKESETDARGIQTSYTYDELGRVHSATRYPANGPVTTVTTYDGAGRTLTRTVNCGTPLKL